jgi:hypothetical protein
MPRHVRAHEAPPAVRVRPTAEWPDVDLPPTVPTLEEIEIADELRRELELRYLGEADPCRDCSRARSRPGTTEDA